MADETSKVFSSTIIRTRKRSTNQYKDLLSIEPAKPVLNKAISIKSCNYEPKNDKFYIPKKKIGSKVKTVRDIRLLFEKDVYSYLINELETQQNFLLRKIRHGYSQDVKLREAAKKMLSSDSPTSKSIWRMLMNINPHEKPFSTQFVLWNGKNIQINGSKGGNNKFLYKYDIAKTKVEKPRKNRGGVCKYETSNQKKSLLQNSLHVKFKPGPLTKKKYLDNSYQKYNFGDMKLVSLPKPGLEIQPTYGKPIPPAISAFLYHSFAENSNIISTNWANFAVSILGTNVNETPVQSKEGCNITFDLSYKCTQNRLLMRHDSEKVGSEQSSYNDINFSKVFKEDSINCQVKSVINNILEAVEISLEQDNMYTGEDESRDSLVAESQSTNIQSKDKMKKKYCELDRLDVTVIRISENTEHKHKTCSNSYCNLGCICDSLSCSYNIKGHCGRIECMFECTCDFAGYQISDFLEHNCTNFLPEIMNNDKNSNIKLAKEEKKFHQTVIVTDEKSIVLKSRKRDWKTSKKYASFYSQMRLKTENNLKKELCVVATKLDCRNIEPLCLVHNLYRCFCKGKFIDTTMVPMEETKIIEPFVKPVIHSPKDIIDTKEITSQNVKKPQFSPERTIKRLRSQSRIAPEITPNNEVLESPHDTCARVLPYDGRKYSNGYYLATNEKIKNMEMNDVALQKKLRKMIDIDNFKEDSSDDSTISLKDMLTNIVENSMTSSNTLVENPIHTLKSFENKRFPNKTKLVAWLESSYKQYKLKADQGIVKSCLGPPQPGKLALYPWHFILSRYREHKNYFLVSTSKPFRLFMTVNEKKLFFESSININNIPWSDIDKYPITVKNLLTNATDLRDNFCILYGLSHSWELIGSVTKVNESVTSADVQILKAENNDISNKLLYVENIQKNKKPCTSSISTKNDDENVQLHEPDIKNTGFTSESSKWFVMTVENDFSEIQFYKKGFFVKYDSVIKAINVARVSGKTVRLSSQKCASQQSEPQFGIYAIPSENDYCVFIGPYEKDEKLGIETINTVTDNRKKRTRGIWIITKKIDNLKVIDNPLSFMPACSNNDNKLIPLHSHITSNVQKYSDVVSFDKQNQNVVKTIKPIRICKTNGFYHLAPNGMLQQISQMSPDKSLLRIQNNEIISKNNGDQSCKINTLHDLRSLDKNEKPENKSLSGSFGSINLNKNVSKKPIAEIAPQVKTPQTPAKRKIEGMFVLKPEEINKRSFEGKIRCDSFSNDMNSSSDNVTDIDFSDACIDLDIENFLATNTVKVAPNDEIFVISDDDEDYSRIVSCDWRRQYIICKNIENLGWISGRRDSENRLSFEFPGFKATEFYSENEAFEKINQVFSRKVYVPKNITLEWRTSDDPLEVEGKRKLDKSELNADYILTKKGLSDKLEILNNIMFSQKNSESSELQQALLNSTNEGEFMEKKNDLLKELDKTSDELESQSDVLWNETLSKKIKLLDSLSEMSSDVRQKLSDILKEMVSDSDNSENT